MQYVPVFLLCLCVAVQADVSSLWNTKKTEAINKCKQELNIPEEDIKITSSLALPTNENQKCLLECIYNKVDLIKNDKLDEESAIQAIKQLVTDQSKAQILEAAIKSCGSQQISQIATEKCSLGRQVRECIVKQPGIAEVVGKKQ